MNQSEALDNLKDYIQKEFGAHLLRAEWSKDPNLIIDNVVAKAADLIKAHESALLNRIEEGLPEKPDLRGNKYRENHGFNEAIREVKQILQKEKDRL